MGFETVADRCSTTALSMLMLDWTHKRTADGGWGEGVGGRARVPGDGSGKYAGAGGGDGWEGWASERGGDAAQEGGGGGAGC